MSGKPLKEHHLRQAIHDDRLLSPPKKERRRRGEKRPRVMGANDAARLYSTTLRTARPELRALLPDEEQLRRYRLPLWRTEADLARALKVSLRQLRFFSVHRDNERFRHYVSFTIPKASGGRRLILAPKRQLKAIHRSLLRKLIDKLPISDHAHGYRKGRSTRTGAEPHVGRRVLLKLDIKDFFPSISYGRIRGLMVALGYGYRVACVLAALMTEAERQPVEVDGVVYHVPVGLRHIVQGAPTSPGLSNCLLLRLDRRLGGLARRFGFTYTRYADDLTFSGDDPAAVYGLRQQATRIIRDEGFEVNADKTRITRRGRCQRVTGVVVNDRLGLSRQERRRLRAEIHQLGQAIQAGTAEPSRVKHVRGSLAYVAMLNPQQADALRRGLPPESPPVPPAP